MRIPHQHATSLYKNVQTRSAVWPDRNNYIILSESRYASFECYSTRYGIGAELPPQEVPVKDSTIQAGGKRLILLALVYFLVGRCPGIDDHLPSVRKTIGNTLHVTESLFPKIAQEFRIGR